MQTSDTGTSETDRDVREVARELSLAFAEGAARRDANRELPDDEVKLLKESGLLSLFVPREFGGVGADYRTAMDVFALLAEGDPNIAHIPQAHHCAVELLKIAGATDVMEWLFPRIVDDGILVPSAYVDRGHKRLIDDVAGVTIQPADDHYVVNGAKFYVTGSRWADVFYAPVKPTEAAATDKRLQGAGNIVAWIEASEPGVTVEDDWDAMGQRTTSSGSVIFEDVPVDSDRVTADDLAADVPHNYFGSHAQIIFCAIQLGTARAALRDTVDYVRTQARPWIHSGVASATEDPFVLHHVGQLDTAIEGAAAVLDRASDALERCRASGNPEHRDEAAVAVARAKIATTEAALRATNDLFQICGTRSTRAEWDLDRHWRNMRTLTLHDPVDYKYKLVGDYVLNATPPPISAWV